jgi:hypothetical protein
MGCTVATRPPGSFRAGFYTQDRPIRIDYNSNRYIWYTHNRIYRSVHGRALGGTTGDAYVAGIDLGTTNSAIAVGAYFPHEIIRFEFNIYT